MNAFDRQTDGRTDRIFIAIDRICITCIAVKIKIVLYYTGIGDVCVRICGRPCVCRLSSVTFMHPTQAIEIFGHVSKPFGTLAICELSVKNFTEIIPGEPLRRRGWGLNRRGVAKYSDFGPFQSYSSETVQNRIY